MNEYKLEPTGYCWKCGLPLSFVALKTDFSFTLFCNLKHQQQWERAQDSKIIKGKRAAYGVKGNFH